MRLGIHNKLRGNGYLHIHFKLLPALCKLTMQSVEFLHNITKYMNIISIYAYYMCMCTHMCIHNSMRMKPSKL